MGVGEGSLPIGETLVQVIVQGHGPSEGLHEKILEYPSTTIYHHGTRTQYNNGTSQLEKLRSSESLRTKNTQEERTIQGP